MRTLTLLLLVGLTAAFRFTAGYTLKGTVTAAGAPVQAATVHVKGTRTAAVTAADGSFAIPVNRTDVLVVSAVGYKTLEVPVRGRTRLHLKLQPVSTELHEVVVTGHAAGVSHDMALQATTGMAAARMKQGNPAPFAEHFNREGYSHEEENSFQAVQDHPVSTFSIDVDAASYSNVRRLLRQGVLPPAGAVRIEEMVNYFRYNYPEPHGEHPFGVHTEINACPWNPQHQLLLVGLQGKRIPADDLPPANLVFLVDVSGSMQSPDKLPLVKKSLRLLTEQLRPSDHVALVVYAGSAGLVLPSTPGSEKRKILDAIDALEAGGSTAGGAGIRLAYSVALKQYMPKGNNRVILCTDGDFNVGTSSDSELVTLIEEKRRSGVFLTVLGYGRGNYQDAKMQLLADKGNGNHHYIDELAEAQKVLVNEFGGTLFTIAKDVKLQLEFNPARVKGYRLIGYENRLLAREDFNDDQKDAGELGSGHTVTALYEIIPVGVASDWLRSTDPLKYQQPARAASGRPAEWAHVKLRYKQPDGDNSRLMELAVGDQKTPPSERFRKAAAVAAFGMLLKNSKYSGRWTLTDLQRELATLGRAENDPYIAELLELVEKTAGLKRGQDLGLRRAGEEEISGQ